MDTIPPTGLALATLDRISPSRFSAMLDCSLREVWVASKNIPSLPVRPAAHIGTVIHKLLELAGNGGFDGASRATVEEAWDRLVREQEAQLKNNLNECANIPLKKSVWRYSVRRILRH